MAKKTEAKRKYEKEGPPVSLHPLSIEEALEAPLQTPAEPEDATASGKPVEPAAEPQPR